MSTEMQTTYQVYHCTLATQRTNETTWNAAMHFSIRAVNRREFIKKLTARLNNGQFQNATAYGEPSKNLVGATQSEVREAISKAVKAR